MEKSSNNVQQAGSLAGQVNSRADEVQGTAGEAENRQMTVEGIVSEAVNEPSAEERKAEERRKALCDTLITLDTEVEPLRFTLSVDGVGLFSLLDIHGVKAKQKHGKTTMLKVCAAAWLKGQQFRVKSELEQPRVLWLDTEQNRPDVKQILTDIVEMTGAEKDYITSHLHVHALRCSDYGDLYGLMVQAVGDFKPQVVVVDGIVEFVASFNDETMAKRLVHDLQVLSQDHECAIVCVLHTNKADEDHNMRGHLGTMLAQKAGTVLECKKNGSVITVQCTESRHKEMPEWSIMFDGEGCIVDADEVRRQMAEQHEAEKAQRKREKAELIKKERLDYALKCINDKGGSIKRSQLTEILIKHFELSRATVSSFISKHVGSAYYEVNGIITLTSETAIPF